MTVDEFVMSKNKGKGKSGDAEAIVRPPKGTPLEDLEKTCATMQFGMGGGSGHSITLFCHSRQRKNTIQNYIAL